MEPRPLPEGRTAKSFEMAFDLVASANLERLVSPLATPLSQYREAIAHAAEAGSRGAIKVVFEQNG